MQVLRKYRSFMSLQLICRPFIFPTHLSLVQPIRRELLFSSTQLLTPSTSEHLGNINERLLAVLPRGAGILSPFTEVLPMAIQSVAELGMGPRNPGLQPSALTTVLFLCSFYELDTCLLVEDHQTAIRW